jgi:hypothetical protein
MARSLEAVLLLNFLFLLAGSGLLWAVRGWRTWGDYVAHAGIAYMVGLAVVCVAATLVLVFGGGLTTPNILVLTLSPALGGASIGVLRGRPLPGRGGWGWLPHRPPDIGPAVLAGATVAVLVELFRVMRTQPLTSWDAWAFWLPKAKAIYYFHGLDPQMFRAISAQSYPLLSPALDAMNFSFMDAADTTTLGIQYWLLLVGFVLAAAPLLRAFAGPTLVWLFLASVVAMPELDRRLPERIADWPLDMFFVLAMLALARWLSTREPWLLSMYLTMFAAMLATKREGQILALAGVVGGLAGAGWRRKKLWWPIVGVTAAAYALNVPWRIWWSSRHLWPDTPPGGIIHATLQYSRILPSLRLVVEVLFRYDLWRLAFPVGALAAVLALTTSARAVGRLYLACAATAIVGFAWATWSTGIPITENPGLNPTPRADGSLALFSLAIAPVLVARVVSAAPLRTWLAQWWEGAAATTQPD